MALHASLLKSCCRVLFFRNVFVSQKGKGPHPLHIAPACFYSSLFYIYSFIFIYVFMFTYVVYNFFWAAELLILLCSDHAPVR